MMNNGTKQSRIRPPALVLAAALAGACTGGTPDPDPASNAGGGAPAFPAPTFHHIHVNSVDPERALDWWATLWPAGQRTTVAGLPAFEADGVYLLYTTVDEPAPGAFDPEPRQSAPQSAFWTTGPSTDGLALYERLTTLDPEGERFGFLPVYTGPDDTEGVPHSGLAPFGDQLLTVAEMAERAAREGSSPARDRASGQDFGYLVDPDGILVEFNGNAATEDLFYGHLHFWHEQPFCAANWYVTHLGVTLPPARDPTPARRRRARRTTRARSRSATSAIPRSCRWASSGRRSRACASPTRGGCGTRASAATAGAAPRGAHRGPRRAGVGADRGGFGLSHEQQRLVPRMR